MEDDRCLSRMNLNTPKNELLSVVNRISRDRISHFKACVTEYVFERCWIEFDILFLSYSF